MPVLSPLTKSLSEKSLKADHSPPPDCGPTRALGLFRIGIKRYFAILPHLTLEANHSPPRPITQQIEATRNDSWRPQQHREGDTWCALRTYAVHSTPAYATSRRESLFPLPGDQVGDGLIRPVSFVQRLQAALGDQALARMYQPPAHDLGHVLHHDHADVGMAL